jgi:glutamate synthase domain-containing protein 2
VASYYLGISGVGSPYHLENGGDLVWQVGTGYFGCRTKQDNFAVKHLEKKPRLIVLK